MDFCKKYFKLLPIIALIISFFTLNIVAADEAEFDEDTKGTITIDYTYNNTTLDDVEFHVYRVADLDQNVAFSNTDKFKNFYIDFEQMDSMDYCITMRDNLQNFIDYQNIAEDAIFTQDSDNKSYNLDDLSVGLYYIQATAHVKNPDAFYSLPIMIVVGQYDDSNSKWLYDFNVEPKISLMMNGAQPDISVKKVWETDAKTLPSVKVALYRNGSVYQTVTLSSANDWEYTWDFNTISDFSFEDSWAVVELTTLENNVVDYSRDFYKFTITNTYDPPVDDDDDDPYTPPGGNNSDDDDDDDPSDSDDPDDPSNPDDPDDPDNPDDPDDPTTPSNPDDPDDPEDPNSPEYPTYPEDPDTPIYPETPNDPSIPQTGTTAYQIPIFAGFGLVFILIGLFIKTKGATNEN